MSRSAEPSRHSARSSTSSNVGTTIRLDRHAGDPVEVYVNGTLFAHGEVVVVQDQLGVKIIELINPAQGARPSGLR